MPSAAAEEQFGAALYECLGGTGNLVFSPVSIAAALELALLGAHGETAAELAAVLRLPGPEAAAGRLREVSGVLAGLAGEDVTLCAPGTVWVQAGLPLQSSYLAALAGLAAVAVREADFRGSAEEARKEINALIAGQTAGKITDLLGPGVIGPVTRLILASAVFLKAAWAHPFPAGATADGPFHPAPGTQVQVPMMHLEARLPYVRAAGYQVAELPYLGGQLSMVIVLPDAAPGPVGERLASRGLGSLLAGLATREVRLALPRFRVTSSFSLVPALTALGVALAFSPGADFTGITAAERLQISEVVHKAYLDVDEHGTEAAAATAVIMRTAAIMPHGPPVELTVDRPFLAAIIERRSGLPLFLGRVTDPASGA